MTNPTSFQNQINPITSETSISSMNFSIMDIGGDATRISTNYIMKNRLVTIYAGYEGFTEDQFTQIYTGQINNWVKSQDATMITFTVVDPLKQLKSTILSGHTQLSADYDPKKSGGVIYVTDTSNLANATDLYDGQGVRNYLRINDTLYSYSGINGHAINGLQQITLNSNGAPDQVQQNGSSVDNYVLYQGNPVTLMLQIALSTGTGLNYSGTGTNYDVLPTSQGIGIPYSLVNISNFEAQRDLYVSDFYFSNYFSEQTEALKFFQEHILRQASCYLFVNRAGQLDIKAYYAPQGTLNAITIDDSNIIGNPIFDANLQTGNDFYNDIDVTYDYQPVQDLFVNEIITENLTSQQEFEEDTTLKIPAKMVKTGFGAEKMISRMTEIFLSRFMTPPPIITLRTFYTNHLLNPGDIVYLNSSVVPNYRTGKNGGPAVLCECISTGTDFSSGIVSVILLGIGFSNQGRFAGIAPDTTPTYSSATDDQKLVDVFISDDNGVMPDMTPAYAITP